MSILCLILTMLQIAGNKTLIDLYLYLKFTSSSPVKLKLKKYYRHYCLPLDNRNKSNKKLFMTDKLLTFWTFKSTQYMHHAVKHPPGTSKESDKKEGIKRFWLVFTMTKFMCIMLVKSINIPAIPRYAVKLGSIHYEVYFCNIILLTNALNFALPFHISFSHRSPL